MARSMGVIDAGSNLWLENVTTGSNSHSIAVDPSNNHAFVPLQAGGQLHDAGQQRLRWRLRSTVSPRPEGSSRHGTRDLECVSSEQSGTSERDIFAPDALRIRQVSRAAQVMGSWVK